MFITWLWPNRCVWMCIFTSLPEQWKAGRLGGGGEQYMMLDWGLPLKPAAPCWILLLSSHQPDSHFSSLADADGWQGNGIQSQSIWGMWMKDHDTEMPFLMEAQHWAAGVRLSWSSGSCSPTCRSSLHGLTKYEGGAMVASPLTVAQDHTWWTPP